MNDIACRATLRNHSYNNNLDSELYIICMSEIILIIKDVSRHEAISLGSPFSRSGLWRAVPEQFVL